VAAPSQSPVNVSREAKAAAVGVGGGIVGNAGAGVATGEAQADSTQSRRMVEKMRMYVSIFEPAAFTTTLQRGLVRMKRKAIETESSLWSA